MWATFETWIVASFSMIPPWACMVWRWWRFTMWTPCTISRFSSRSTFMTSPVLPLSRPVITTTLSPFLIFSFVAISLPNPSRSKHFWCQRDDLHELLRTELAGHRAEDAGPDRLALLVDQHRRIAIEADRAAVGAVDLLGGPDDHRLVHVALLHLAARDRLLDRDDDHVAHARGAALGTAQHLDALHAARAGIVGNVQVRLHLDHGSVLLLRGRGGVGGVC